MSQLEFEEKVEQRFRLLLRLVEEEKEERQNQEKVMVETIKAQG